MHRMPGALERDAADYAALADHVATSANHAYTQLRDPLWSALGALGFAGGDVLVQGDGAPTLLALPGGFHRTVDFITARLLPRWHDPSHDPAHDPTQQAVTGGVGDYDLVIASLPWADVQLRDRGRWVQRIGRHTDMTIAAARLTRPGGLVAVLATHDLMDTPAGNARRAIARHAAFLGAVRLPAGALRPQAGNDNVVDLMLFTARDPRHEAWGRRFEPAVQIPLPGAAAVINQYFDDHPEQVLGSIDLEASVWGHPCLTVIGDPAAFAGDVAQALQNLTAAAVRDGLSAAPPGPRASAGVGGWLVEGAHRYLPPVLKSGRSRDPSRMPEQWPAAGPPAPGVDL